MRSFIDKIQQKFPLIKDLAQRIFSVVCTTAAAERNFSLQGFIHSKYRSRLNPEKVSKLAYIKSNFKLIESQNNLSFNDSDDDDEDIDESDSLSV